jgi:hypothetical protein
MTHLPGFVERSLKKSVLEDCMLHINNLSYIHHPTHIIYMVMQYMEIQVQFLHFYKRHLSLFCLR